MDGEAPCFKDDLIRKNLSVYRGLPSQLIESF